MRPSVLGRSRARSFEARLRVLSAIVVVIGALAFISAAQAIEITKHSRDNDRVNAILLSGDIEPDDLYRLQVFITKLPNKPRTSVILNSRGGKIDEGIKLGRFFYRAKIETIIMKGAECLSACALAFLGGRDARNGKHSRTKSSAGVLGFHSFSKSFDREKAYSADDMAALVQDAQNKVLDIADYLADIDTNLDFLRVMIRASSSTMNIVSNDEALAADIRVWDEQEQALVSPDNILDILRR
ncbi:MAG: hypothetical protein JOZ70_13535 [Pseudolabrys sp.]|nr:hypothetical protein [Pseudolabrys sp.]MBV9956259.1 hypothetical protein [Pseudolabrys sp.]